MAAARNRATLSSLEALSTTTISTGTVEAATRRTHSVSRAPAL